jgi:hypothetical protein
MTMVYRFEFFDGNDYMLSSRWATRDRVAQNPWARIIGDGVEVADELVGKEIEGMTARNFDPKAAKQ